MTEDEAKTKWCPFARNIVTVQSPVGHAVAAASGNQFDNQKKSICIGSACMAWRAVAVADTRERALYRKGTDEQCEAGHSDTHEWRLVNPDEPPPASEGFCGLAGQP